MRKSRPTGNRPAVHSSLQSVLKHSRTRSRVLSVPFGPFCHCRESHLGPPTPSFLRLSTSPQDKPTPLDLILFRRLVFDRVHTSPFLSTRYSITRTSPVLSPSARRQHAARDEPAPVCLHPTPSLASLCLFVALPASQLSAYSGIPYSVHTGDWVSNFLRFHPNNNKQPTTALRRSTAISD